MIQESISEADYLSGRVFLGKQNFTPSSIISKLSLPTSKIGDFSHIVKSVPHGRQVQSPIPVPHLTKAPWSWGRRGGCVVQTKNWRGGVCHTGPAPFKVEFSHPLFFEWPLEFCDLTKSKEFDTSTNACWGLVEILRVAYWLTKCSHSSLYWDWDMIGVSGKLFRPYVWYGRCFDRVHLASHRPTEL